MNKTSVGEHVLIRTMENGGSKGDLFLPADTNPALPGKGEAVSINSSETEDFDVHAGDIVYFDAFNVYEVGDLIAVKAEHILCVEDRDEDAYEIGSNVRRDIDLECECQGNEWGGASFDDTYIQADWQSLINEYSQGKGRAARYDFRTRMVKTAAIAVAALESYDRGGESFKPMCDVDCVDSRRKPYHDGFPKR